MVPFKDKLYNDSTVYIKHVPLHTYLAQSDITKFIVYINNIFIILICVPIITVILKTKRVNFILLWTLIYHFSIGFSKNREQV